MLGEGGMAEEGFARADGKGNDRSRLGEIPVDAIGYL
jgi:hypothetical protein